MRTLRTALMVTVTLTLLAALGRPTAVGGQEPPTATISGNAYTFNTRNVIAGATIRAVEHPDVSTMTAADGSYTLSFPVGAEVTLYIEAAGHATIHIQTFTLDDEHQGTAVVGANFQTPSLAVYDGLRALVTSYIGSDPFDEGCVIVTTVGMAELAGMPFEEFIGFAPHGVEGATATLDPPVAEPIYFNESVLPDVTQQTTSNDGGVLWANVPPGEYRLSADHPTVEFTTADVRCEAGWVVNANPVWGLHAVDPTTTTPTTTTSTTTPPVSTSTTMAATSTTSADTSTTTTPSTTSTTEGGSSTSAVSDAPPVAPTPTVDQGGHVASTPPTRDQPTTLSRTGAEPGRAVNVAIALIVGGSLLLAINGRRRAAVGDG